jgi:hypothetical protein
MPAYDVQIATAVTAELNDAARAWHSSFTAVRRNDPWYDTDNETVLAALKAGLQVAVVALKIDERDIDRVENEFDYAVTIDFQQLVDVTDTAAQDALSLIVEQVQDFFLDDHELATLSDWYVVGAHRPEVYSLEKLYAEGLWETEIQLKVQGWR